MSKETIKALKAERSYVKGSVTRFASYLNKLSDDTDLVEVQSRYDNYKALLEQYHEIQLKITKLDETEVDEQEITEFEDSYYALVKKAKHVLASKDVTEFEDSYYALVKKAKHVLASKDVPSIKPVKPETEGSEVILRDFYVDDLLTGADTLADAITGADTLADAMKIRQEVVATLSCGKMELRKWASNEPSLLIDLSNSSNSHVVLSADKGEDINMLDLLWNSKSDILQYSTVSEHTRNFTKRNILCQISKIFDPLDLIAPLTIRAKILMQEIWQLKLNWDESLPLHIR
ncbi:Pao retrotransposon peptidase [Popillia japonica]|uniref:Pao retrotransposon peptidase n=1 Tax=Popillia japonica TaxID=7064 RepID=A0AAW1JHF0_POPJA